MIYRIYFGACRMAKIHKIERISPSPVVDIDQAIHDWVAGTTAAHRIWAEKTARRVKGTLRHLYRTYGIPPEMLLSVLFRQKRLAAVRSLEEKEGITDRIKEIQTFFRSKEAKRLGSALDAVKDRRLVLNYLGINPGAVDILRSKQVRRGRPKKSNVRALLLPFVEIFTQRTGNPLWEHAAALVAAAFPHVKFRDPKKSAYDKIKPSGTELAADYAVPPLHEVRTRSARRLAVQALMDRAREDRDDLRTVKLINSLKAQPKQGKAVQTQRERNPICRAIGCAAKKQAYEKVRGRQKREWRQSDEKGGWFFLCVMCGRVRHSRCDGLVEAVKRDTCSRCARRMTKKNKA